MTESTYIKLCDKMENILYSSRYNEALRNLKIKQTYENILADYPVFFIVGEHNSIKSLFITKMFGITEIPSNTRFLVLIDAHPNNNNTYDISINNYPFQRCNGLKEIIDYYDENRTIIQNVIVRYNFKHNKIIKIYNIPSFNTGKTHAYYSSVMDYINMHKNAHVINLSPNFNNEYIKMLNKKVINISDNICTVIDNILSTKIEKIIFNLKILLEKINMKIESNQIYYNPYIITQLEELKNQMKHNLKSFDIKNTLFNEDEISNAAIQLDDYPTDNLQLKMFDKCVNYVVHKYSIVCINNIYNNYETSLKNLFELKNTLYMYKHKDEIIYDLSEKIKNVITININQIKTLIYDILETTISNKNSCSIFKIFRDINETIQTFWLSNVDIIYYHIIMNLQNVIINITNIINEYIDSIDCTHFIINAELDQKRNILMEINHLIKN